MTARQSRPVYIVALKPLPGVNGIRALRGALKVLKRCFGLQATSIHETKNERAAKGKWAG